MPDWDAVPPLGGWDGTPVDWDEFTTPPPSGVPEVALRSPSTPFFPLRHALAHTFRFDLLDAGLGKLDELHPVRASRIQITNSPPGAIKRKLTNMQLPPSEAAKVDTVTMRVMPWYVPADGSPPSPLGVFMWADATRMRRTSGEQLDSTLHDQGIIWSQPLVDPISYPSGASVYDALFQIMGWLGFPNARIDPIGDQLAAPVAWPANNTTPYFKPLAELCTKYATLLEPYFDNSGVPVLRAVGDLSTTIPTLSYDDDERTGRIHRGSILVSDNVLSAPNLYKVVDTSIRPGQVVAEYQVPEDAPHSRARRGWWSTHYIEVQGVASQAEAESIALNTARQDQGFEDISFTAVIDPRHDTYDPIRVLNSDYLETEWTMTLGPGGPMAHKGKRIRHSEVRAPGGVIGTQPGIPVPPSDPGTPTDPPPAEPDEVLVSTLQAEGADLSSAPPPSSGSGWWEVDAAGRFISPDGARTRLLGFNGSVDVSAGAPFIFNMPTDGGGRETFTGHTGDIANWGANIVRCVVLPSGTYGQTANVNAVRDLVIANAASKIATLVYCLESQAPTSSNTASAGTAPFSTVILPFFQALLAAVPAGALPYLWLNPNGENREDSNFAAWKTLNDGLYSAIRGYTNGANVWLSFSTYNFAQVPLSVANWNSFASGKTRVSMGIHAYGAQNAPTAEASRAALRAGNVPFMVEETGWQYDGFSACCGSDYATQRSLGLQALNDWYAAKGESVIIWIGTSDTNTTSGFSMRNPPGGYLAYSKTRSEMGETFWNVRTLAKTY